MVGAVLQKLLLALGVRKPDPVAREAPPPPDDDVVARYGLSHGEAADPISEEAYLEVERLKCVRPPRR